MEIISNLMSGFSIVLNPMNLLACFIGVFIGTLTGVLPGFGPLGAMCMLFPLSFTFSPVTGLILLSGIYYGAMYGGSTTSILVNIPGETASVVSCLDGYQMAKQGLAGPALGIAAFGSFIAGTVGLVMLMLLAPPLAEFALKFGPPEYFAVMIAGLTMVTYLAKGSMLKGWIMILLGFILGGVGTDIFTGAERLTMDADLFRDGLDLAPIAMGIFGLGEIFINIEERIVVGELLTNKLTGLLPTLKQWKDAAGPILRGSFLGFFLGILPGGGVVIASFASYAMEKKLSKHPERFGTGAIEGLAGPESANNAATAGAFVPLLSLGIPSNPVTALLLGAFMVHGVQPGPLLISNHPDMFWGVIASIYIGNAMLLLLNLPLIPMWVRLLRIPYAILFPVILFLCVIGVYSLKNSTADIFIMLFFGVIGYIMRKTDFEGAPLLLSFILGPMIETAFKQSLRMSDGTFLVFFTSPISLIFLVIALLSVITSMSTLIRAKIQKIV